MLGVEELALATLEGAGNAARFKHMWLVYGGVRSSRQIFDRAGAPDMWLDVDGDADAQEKQQTIITTLFCCVCAQLRRSINQLTDKLRKI